MISFDISLFIPVISFILALIFVVSGLISTAFIVTKNHPRFQAGISVPEKYDLRYYGTRNKIVDQVLVRAQSHKNWTRVISKDS